MSIYVVGHKNPDTDSICAALGYAAFKQAMGEDAVAIRCGEINKETQYALDYFDVAAPILATKVEAGQKVIQVDHNEVGQAIDGLAEAELLEIVDHHRFGGLNTAGPIFVHTEPVGCTSTIIANMFWNNNIKIPKEIAGLLLSAIMSDTVLYKSPTCTDKDHDAAEKLAEIAEVELHEYAMAMLKAGAGVGDMTPAEIAKNDSKPFSFGSYKALVSQISVMDTAEVLDMKADITAAMKDICDKEGYTLIMLMVTDIIDESTDLVFYGEPKQLIADAFKQDASGDCIHLPGVMSRKKQIVPPLTEAAAKF